MQKNIAIAAALLGIISTGGFAFAQVDNASSTSDTTTEITFPIPELGNCASKSECKAYCSNQTHTQACIAFGESHGFIKHDEAVQARTFSTMKGPGGCIGIACKAYCSNPDHVDECLAFAEVHGLVRAEEVKIIKVIRESGGPGGCKSESECRSYCSDSAHRDECKKFAEDNGLTSGDHAQAGVNEQGNQHQFGPQGTSTGGNPKIQEILATKGGPGGCLTEIACKAYCQADGHMKECLQFGKDNGLISSDEYDRAQKFANQTGPGGCKGEACKTYCEDVAHTEECLKFAEQNGLMSKDEASKARTLAGKPGPGGCRGEECKTYCADQSHHDECVSFAVQNGFMTQAQADQNQNLQPIVGPGGCTAQECRIYCSDPAHRDECISFAQEHKMMRPPGSDQRNMQGQNDTQGNGPNQFPPSEGDNQSTSSFKGHLPAQTMTHPPCTNSEECAALRLRMLGSTTPDQSGETHMPPDVYHQDQRPMPAQLTPEQQKMYNAYMQSHPKSAGDTQNNPAGSDQSPHYQNQGQYPQKYEGQYQQGGQYQGQGASQGGRTTPTPPPTSPTSGIMPTSFVASVFSIFAQLFGL